MQFSIRTTNYQKNPMLNICDSSLLGKTIVESKLEMRISKSYYGERLVQREAAIKLLQDATIINMVGDDTISLALDLKIGTKDSIKKIDGVPFLLVFKM